MRGETQPSPNLVPGVFSVFKMVLSIRHFENGEDPGNEVDGKLSHSQVIHSVSAYLLATVLDDICGTKVCEMKVRGEGFVGLKGLGESLI